MQITRLHVQPHSLAAPKSQKLVPTGSGETDSGPVNPRKRVLEQGPDQVQRYMDELKDISEVRADVVEAARIRLASGEYTTKRAARETAAAILKRS